MNIQVGKYKLTSSLHDFTVSETKATTQGKKIGTEFESNYSYHPTLVSALENILKRRVMQSDATTLKQLVRDVQESREELQSLLGGLE